MSMRLFRSTTLDSNANTYVGDQLSLFVGNDYILRISDNTTPGGVTVKGGGSGGTGSFVRSDITATSGQTAFTATYTPNYVDVYYNGLILPVASYTATNGSTVTLNNPAIAGDTVTIIAWSISNVSINTGDITFGTNGNPNGISSSDNDAYISINAPGVNGAVDLWSGGWNGPFGGEVYMDSSGVWLYTNDESNYWLFDNSGNLNLAYDGGITFTNGTINTVGGGINVRAYNGSFTISVDETLQPTTPYVAWTFDQSGVLALPDGGYIDNNGGITRLGAGNVGAQIGSADTQNYATATDTGVVIQTLADSTNSNWTFDLNGNLTLPSGGTINWANGSNALVGGGGGNASTGDITFAGNVISSTNGNIVIGTALVPSGNATIDLGTIDNQWRSLYVSGQTIYLGGVPLSTSGNSLIVNGSAVATTGNITFTDTTLGTVNTGSNVNISLINGEYLAGTGGSLSFDGSSYLTYPGVSMGSGAFTAQLWFYIPISVDLSSIQLAFLGSNNNSQSLGIYTGSGQGGAGYAQITIDALRSEHVTFYVGRIPQGQWNHLAVARDSSNNVNVWLNGQGQASQSWDANFSGLSEEIGGWSYGGYYMQGWITNLELIVGGTIFDPNSNSITVPTPPLTSVEGTELLLLASSATGALVDSSYNNYTMTPMGAVTYSGINNWEFSADGTLTLPASNSIAAPIGSNVNISTTYQQVNINQAAYMDFNASGGTEWVSMSPGIQLNDSAFSIQFWIYRRNLFGHAFDPILSFLASGTASPFLYFNDSNQLIFDPYYMTLPVTMQNNTWYHVAVARDASGNLNAWLDGTQITGGTIASAVLTDQAVGPMTEIGYLWYGPSYLNAALSSLQIVVGNNVYDPTQSTITVPTDVPVVIPGTVLLLSTSYHDYAAFDDASGTQTITNNNSTPAFQGAPVNNVEIINSTLAWQFMPGAEGNPQLLVPNAAVINSHHNLYLNTDAGMLGLYGTEGINLTASGEGYINFDVLQAPSGYGAYNGGAISTNAGGGADGGEGGSINFYAGNGSGNTITHSGGEGGSINMSGGRGDVYVSAAAITAITLTTPVTITVPNNNVAYGGKIYIQSLATATELNNASYYVIPTGGDNLQLFRDQWLQIPVVSTGVSPYFTGNVTTVSTVPINTNFSQYQCFLDINPSSNLLISNLGYGLTVNSGNLAAYGAYNVSTSPPLQPTSGDTSTDLYFNLNDWLGGSLEFNSGYERWLAMEPGVTFGTNPWTVSTWFQLYTNTSGTILGGQNSNSLKINIVSDTQIAVGPAGGSPTVFTVPTMGPGTWIWLTVNSDADGTSLYYNGVAATGSPGPNADYTAATNGIGYTAWSGPDYFDGRLQGMQITNGTAVYSSLDSTIPVPTYYTDPTQGSFSLLLNGFQGNTTVDSSGTQTITNLNNVRYNFNSPVSAWGPDVDWVFTVPATGTITASTNGGSLWLYGGSPSNPSYGSEGRVYVQSNLSVNSVEPYYYGTDLLLKNQNSSYNFNNQSTISSPGGTQYTPYEIAASGPEINWNSLSPFSNVVTTNGSINSVYNRVTNLQPPMPAIRQSAYTISLWFYPASSSGNNTLLGGDNGSLNLISQTLSDLIITTGNPATATGFSFGRTLATDQWYYLVVTRDDQHRCAAWLDGEYLFGGVGYNDGIDINDYTSPIRYLGGGTYGRAFDGLVADVKIDNVNLYSTWGPGVTGSIPVPAAPAVPGYSTQLLLSATDSDNVFVNSANTVVYTPFTIANGGTELGISSDGSIYLPGTRFGNVSISGTVTTVGGLYPAVALPSQNVYLWYASSPDVRGFKMTVRAQHNDPCTCLEMADITCAYDAVGGLVFSVGNRVKSNPGAADTVFGVLIDYDIVPGEYLLVVTATVGSADTVYFTYEVTEFMTSHAT